MFLQLLFKISIFPNNKVTSKHHLRKIRDTFPINIQYIMALAYILPFHLSKILGY